MSLHTSKFTYHSLASAGKATFQSVVDTIVKEADSSHLAGSVQEEGEAVPCKKRRTNDETAPQQLFRHHQDHSGLIEEITVKDFMCHDVLTVKFTKNISFIVGINGSGKSAVLTAIVVALGGTASHTGRGTALKDFVRRGYPSAKVTCVISNMGPIHFKRQLYGDHITIVRTIHSHGGSSVQLKSDKGKVISSKLEELRNMTLALGIQVDNPISILDQNTARQFLKQSKPSDKFELFMRATNLECLQNLFRDISMYLDKTKQELEMKERQFVGNNAELLEARKKYDMVVNLNKDRTTITELKMELLWAQVRDMLNALVNRQKELSKLQKEIENLHSTASPEAETQLLQGKIESSIIGIGVLEAEVHEMDNDIKTNQLSLSIAVKTRKKLEKERANIANRIKSDEETIEDYKAEILSQEKRMLPEHLTLIHKQKEEVLALLKLMEEHEMKRTSSNAEVQLLKTRVNEVNEHVEELKRRKKFCEEEIRKFTLQLQGLESEESNLTVFGPCMPALIQQIENCHQWKKKPLGPLGSYVRLKDPKWTLSVENVLKPRLFTFVVETKDDEKRLLLMVKQTVTRGWKPSVVRFSCPMQPYNISKTTCRTRQYSNVLDVVEISNPIAKNILIDMCKLESTLLIPTGDEAFSLLKKVDSVPVNCYKAFTLKGDSYVPSPKFGTYGATVKSVKILQTSRDELIRETRLQLQEGQSQLQIIDQECNASVHEKASIAAQMTLCDDAVRAVTHQYLVTQTRLERLKDIEQPDTNSVSVLKEELSVKEDELQAKRQMLQGFPAELRLLENQIGDLIQTANEKTKKTEEIKQKIVVIQNVKKKMKEQIDDLNSAQASRKQKLEKVKKLEEVIISECKELEEKHNKMSNDAQRLEDHFLTDVLHGDLKEFQSFACTRRLVQEVDKELKTLMKKLASVEKSLGVNTDHFHLEFHEKLNIFKSTEKRIAQLKKNSDFLKHALDERTNLYQTQKKLTCAVASHQFTRVLLYTNCSGNFKISFNQKTLDIIVRPLGEGEQSGSRGTSSLSGGESSYATMAFVIALWNVTELPFYFLDEPDVYMDKVNRETVLKLILNYATQKKGYQFAFLTPLELPSHVLNSEQVLVLKLNDHR